MNRRFYKQALLSVAFLPEKQWYSNLTLAKQAHISPRRFGTAMRELLRKGVMERLIVSRHKITYTFYRRTGIVEVP